MINSFLMILICFTMIYFLLIKPQIKSNKEQSKMLSSIKKGDDIIINNSIIGKVIKLNKNYTEVQIAETTIIKIQKNAISNILPKGSINNNKKINKKN